MKILVTDPCYLISNDDWDNLCEMTNQEVKSTDVEEWCKRFSENVTSRLVLISGDSKAVADNTGFGDWANEIGGKPFYADAGMVCVVKCTDALKEYMDKDMEPPIIGLAILEVPDDAYYEIDTENPEWSVVKIYNSDGDLLYKSAE